MKRPNKEWVDAVDEVAKLHKLILLVYTKDEIESWCGEKLTEEQWEGVQKRLRKSGWLGETYQFVCELAEDELEASKEIV